MIRLIFIWILSSCFLTVSAQDTLPVQSGFTSLTISLKGNYSDSIPLSEPFYTNLLTEEVPAQFERINDSTYFLSFYAFGPSRYYFRYNNHYLTGALVPNERDILIINYTDSIHYTLQYNGRFKTMFDESESIAKAINSFVFGSGHKNKEKRLSTYHTANEFRDEKLKMEAGRLDNATAGITSPFVKQLIKEELNTAFVKTSLIKDYQKDISHYNKSLGLDSLAALQAIPKRDLSYYNALITSDYTNPSSLMTLKYGYLKSILQDSLLALPDITTEGSVKFKSRLQELFGHIFTEKENLFYDILIATAYITKIRENATLLNNLNYQVTTAVKNAQLREYILETYKTSMSNNRNASNEYYLPFDKSNNAVWTDILKPYKGKAIIMDCWATWCGPCIESFETSKNLKKQYANRDDVVFVYVTDETSNYESWKNYVHILGGEHYYIAKNQMKDLYDQFNMPVIPSYLIFNKSGTLVQQSIGTYMGNDKAAQWIKQALADQ
ncbi:redoxin family protein [Sphingobacterium sp. N143]|uniref:TlpA family protein disulfide reductase n=1 Tax=Sphingobacterium sp. N143 TaxID=2746727 RepID=UPI0025774894|nr:thioredoxin-like domain-containing protein [Sphingobacterium sp. N143]MDM1295042.1 redoxin family protein [Sphingobacterium sp. N143]